MRRLLAVIFGIVLIAACDGSTRKFGAHTDRPAHPPPSTTATATPPHARLVVAVTVVRTPQGYQLRVRPTKFGRNWAWEQSSRALSEALRLAQPLPVHVTATTRASLLNQLHCHAAFAMTKPTWDIETWRPDVGYTRTVGALCNPV